MEELSDQEIKDIEKSFDVFEAAEKHAESFVNTLAYWTPIVTAALVLIGLIFTILFIVYPALA